VAEKQAAAAVALAELSEQTARATGEALDALRRAEEARKAKGRLRRAWDGWRGR
jgi:hypothetical protein